MKEDVNFIEFDCIECQVQAIIPSKIYQEYGPYCEDCVYNISALNRAEVPLIQARLSAHLSTKTGL